MDVKLGDDPAPGQAVVADRAVAVVLGGTGVSVGGRVAGPQRVGELRTLDHLASLVPYGIARVRHLDIVGRSNRARGTRRHSRGRATGRLLLVLRQREDA